MATYDTGTSDDVSKVGISSPEQAAAVKQALIDAGLLPPDGQGDIQYIRADTGGTSTDFTPAADVELFVADAGATATPEQRTFQVVTDPSANLVISTGSNLLANDATGVLVNREVQVLFVQ